MSVARANDCAWWGDGTILWHDRPGIFLVMLVPSKRSHNKGSICQNKQSDLMAQNIQTIVHSQAIQAQHQGTRRNGRRAKYFLWSFHNNGYVHKQTNRQGCTKLNAMSVAQSIEEVIRNLYICAQQCIISSKLNFFDTLQPQPVFSLS